MKNKLQDFLDLCDQTQAALGLASPEERFVYVNRSFSDILGYKPDDVLKQTIREIVEPEHLKRWEEVLESLTRRHPSSRLKLALRTQAGKSLDVAGTVSRRFMGANPSNIRLAFRPDDEHTKTEEELDRLFNLSLDLLCVAGTDGYFKQINPAFERVLGYDKKELLSRSFLEFVHPDDRPQTLAEVQRLAEGLPVVDFRNRYLAKDGRYRWLAWRSAPLAEWGLIYAVARDITEQIRIEELLVRQTKELARSNADLEEFASIASHDLRAPLRAIANLSEWIKEDIPGDVPEPVSQNLKKLRQQIHRMEAMTDDLLTFARAGKERHEISEIDTGDLVRHVLQLLSPPKHFQFVVASNMPQLVTARPPLELVFRNLISNAVKHHDRQNGTITISNREKGKYFDFLIKDDGPGIPKEHQDQVFKMFHTLRSRDEVEGSGIGLPLVKRTVEGYGGKVWIESEGRGTTFCFSWPKKAY